MQFTLPMPSLQTQSDREIEAIGRAQVFECGVADDAPVKAKLELEENLRVISALAPFRAFGGTEPAVP